MDEQNNQQIPEQVQEVSVPKNNNKISIPAAILVGAVIIGLSIIFALSPRGATPTAQQGNQKNPVPQQAGDLEQIKPVTAKDHIRGNPNAPVKIVEYSDTECPFCKRFHATMKQVMADYIDSGKVAWVYRNFPLDSLHSKARSEAVALECANDIGGNDKFWEYTDRLYEITPSNDGLNAAELPKIAAYVGLDVNKFNTCLTSGKFDQHIEDDVQDAVATGGQGTPWNIVISKNGKKYPISGAYPYEEVKKVVEQALAEK
jgi:protein-disulfide isomerase